MSQIYFFRHAQASYLSDNYDKLSPHGEIQSAALGQYLVEKKIHLDRIYVGPLVRQRHTQEIVSKAFLDTHAVQHQPILMPEMEEHFGPQALKFMYPKLIEREPQVRKWYDEIVANEGVHAIKKRNSLMIFEHFIDKWVNGEMPEVHEVYESWQLFRQRVKQGLDKILSETGKGETIGVFTSGGVVSAIVAEALAITDQVKVARLNYAVKNTSFTQLAYSRNQFNLMGFNEVPHLPHDMVTFI
jgi:broad specificity phosphatase PhoE